MQHQRIDCAKRWFGQYSYCRNQARGTGLLYPPSTSNLVTPVDLYHVNNSGFPSPLATMHAPTASNRPLELAVKVGKPYRLEGAPWLLMVEIWVAIAKRRWLTTLNTWSARRLLTSLCIHNLTPHLMLIHGWLDNTTSPVPQRRLWNLIGRKAIYNLPTLGELTDLPLAVRKKQDH